MSTIKTVMNIVRRNALLSLNAARIQTICEASSHGYRDLALQYFEDAFSALVDLVEYDKRGSISIDKNIPSSQQEASSDTSIANITSLERAQNSLTHPTCSQFLQHNVLQRSDAASSRTGS